MSKVQYTYLSHDRQSDRSVVMDEEVAARQLGERSLAGWDVVSRWFDGQDGYRYTITYVLSTFGQVWAIYVPKGWTK